MADLKETIDGVEYELSYTTRGQVKGIPADDPNFDGKMLAAAMGKDTEEIDALPFSHAQKLLVALNNANAPQPHDREKYKVGSITFGQSKSILGPNPPAPDVQVELLLQSALGMSEEETNDIPVRFFSSLYEEILQVNGLKAAKGGDGNRTGEEQVSMPSGPS